MTAQDLYDARETLRFCGGDDLHKFFAAHVGDPSPKGRTPITKAATTAFVKEQARNMLARSGEQPVLEMWREIEAGAAVHQCVVNALLEVVESIHASDKTKFGWALVKTHNNTPQDENAPQVTVFTFSREADANRFKAENAEFFRNSPVVASYEMRVPAYGAPGVLYESHCEGGGGTGVRPAGKREWPHVRA
jgi:hypothetical protein